MPRNKHPEETVQRILDASLKLFLEKGYEETTVLDIISELGGLTRGAFYHHFKSKEEVFDVLSEKLFYDDNPFAKAKARRDLNGLEKLKFVQKDSFRETDSRKLSIASIQLVESPSFLKKLIETNRDTLAPMFEELIEEGIKDGSVTAKHAKPLSQLAVMLTNFWMVPSVFPCETEEELWERLSMIKEITDKIGMPVIDEEILSMCRENTINID